MRCSMGKKWNSETCIGDIKKYTWRSTTNLSANFSGYSDWRMTTIKELNTLFYCSNGKKLNYKKDTWDTRKSEGFYVCKSDDLGDYQRPTINQQAFPNMYSGNCWSSSPFTGYSDYAWILFFDEVIIFAVILVGLDCF